MENKQTATDLERYYDDKPCSSCGGNSQWFDDFTFKGRKYIVHKCADCGDKTFADYSR
jgi:hypothetical protein